MQIYLGAVADLQMNLQRSPLSAWLYAAHEALLNFLLQKYWQGFSIPLSVCVLSYVLVV